MAILRDPIISVITITARWPEYWSLVVNEFLYDERLLLSHYRFLGVVQAIIARLCCRLQHGYVRKGKHHTTFKDARAAFFDFRWHKFNCLANISSLKLFVIYRFICDEWLLMTTCWRM